MNMIRQDAAVAGAGEAPFLFLFFFSVFEKWRFWCCSVVPNEPDSPPPLPHPAPFFWFFAEREWRFGGALVSSCFAAVLFG